MLYYNEKNKTNMELIGRYLPKINIYKHYKPFNICPLYKKLNIIHFKEIELQEVKDIFKPLAALAAADNSVNGIYFNQEVGINSVINGRLEYKFQNNCDCIDEIFITGLFENDVISIRLKYCEKNIIEAKWNKKRNCFIINAKLFPTFCKLLIRTKHNIKKDKIKVFIKGICLKTPPRNYFIIVGAFVHQDKMGYLIYNYNWSCRKPKLDILKPWDRNPYKNHLILMLYDNLKGNGPFSLLSKEIIWIIMHYLLYNIIF